MPELPEVQTVVNDLIGARILGRLIMKASVYWHKSVDHPPVRTFLREIEKNRIERIWRRGKFIVFDLSSSRHLLVHLRMTGRFDIVAANRKRTTHHHVILHLSDGRQLRFHDTRKFGRFYLVEKLESVIGHLGPEPFDKNFSAQKLFNMMQKRQRQLKPLLLDQRFMAGLGNIYVDEALWHSHLHPEQKAADLTHEDARRLHRAIRKVLRQGLSLMGTTLGRGNANFYSVAGNKGRNSDALNVFRRTGEPCLRCGETILRKVVGQRGTHICPRCQKIP